MIWIIKRFLIIFYIGDLIFLFLENNKLIQKISMKDFKEKYNILKIHTMKNLKKYINSTLL